MNLQARESPAKLALTNVRLFDGDRITEPATVVIDGAEIGRDTIGASAIDCQGAVLLPGLIDAHIHLKNTDTLVALADHGVTTGLDMSTWPVGLIESLRDQPGLTDIRSAGVGATSPDSAHSRMVRDRAPQGLVADPRAAVRYVDDRIAEGADYIKVIIDLPGFDQATVDALVAAAHDRGKQVIAHAAAAAAVLMAQDAGVDIVTHVPLDLPLDERAVSRMVADRRIVVPTLTMMEAIVENVRRARKLGPDEGPSYAAARESVTSLHRAGVPVLAGTDANATEGVPASPPFGASLHHELELLVDAGLSPLEALRAATSLPAKHFRLFDRGVIAPGKRADLVLIEGDPLDDIRDTRHIVRVWCAGIERVRT